MNKIIEIWKEVIYIAAKFSNYTESEKQQIIKHLSSAKEKLNNSESEYAKTILWFIYDLENDLENNRKLQIDTIKHDDYLENYFVTKKELSHYNKLIDEDLYIEVFEKINNNSDIETINNLVIKIEKHFQSEIKNISAENIAKNLLIFTLYERKITSFALKRLYNFLLNIPQSKESLIRIRSMISLYYTLVQEVLMFSIQCYNKKNYNNFYMRFVTQKSANWKIKQLKSFNASQQNYRTWNHDYEYKYLLKKLRWN